MSLTARKRAVLALMLLSYLPVLLFLNYSFVEDADTLLKLLASLTGMIGVILMLWQYLLGVRALVSKFVPDLIWVNNLHKKLGIYGFLIIAIHPTFMTLYYLTVGINLLSPGLATKFEQYKALGGIAFMLLAFTWITSALVRDRISFRWWKRIHFINLVILPLALIHSLNIGLTLITSPLRYYWYLICAVVIVILIYRFILFQFLGLNRARYTVVGMQQITPNVVQIDMSPTNKALAPNPGQFIYFHPLRMWETHPFTVSQYNPETRIISITPKCSGPFSCAIQDLKPGTEVWLDGPYGVFTQEVYTTSRPIVLVAGGIGITPFIHIIEKLKEGLPKEVVLFYGNQSEKETAYLDLIQQTAKNNHQFKFVPVMSKDDDYHGEKGYIDGSLLHKHLKSQSKYEYFVCGPVPMMKLVEKSLLTAGVPHTQIHMEKFSL